MKPYYRVLILDSESRAAVESCMALGREGIRVDVASEDQEALSFRSKYTESKIIQPTGALSGEFISWLKELDRNREYSLIIPSTEVSLNMLRPVADGDPLRSKFVIPSDNALETSLDKWRTCELAARLGVALPESVLIEDIEDKTPTWNFPVVLKPIRSKVYNGEHYIYLAARIADNENTRGAILRQMLRVSPVLQQEYIAGTGLGIELLYDKGKLLWHFAHERIHEIPLTGGGSSYRRSIHAPGKALVWAKALLDALDWHGVAMVEFKTRPDGTFCLMEINPRLWGSLALSIDAGVNFPIGLLKVAIGQSISPQPEYKINYYTRNLSLDIEWSKDNIRADHTDPLLLTKPVVRSVIEYLRPLLGKESWDHFDIKDPEVTLTILKQVIKENVTALWRKVRDRYLVRTIKRNHANIFRTKMGQRVENVLFLCYGNICRSPFAQYIAETTIPGCKFKSAGFHGKAGRASPAHIVEVASGFKVNLSDHTSTIVTSKMVSQADMILLMDIDNYKMLKERFPEAISRSTMLGLFSPNQDVEIADPYDMTVTEAVYVLCQIGTSIEGLREWLVKQKGVTH